jgi:glycosyltransferase involved in cell wall biosynthesis
MKISLIIRTYNEEKHLPDLLKGINSQSLDGLDKEVLLVDSGSTDGTVRIAQEHNAKILHISKEEFSFGRSLNIGCAEASGDILVMVSGHCIPIDHLWLINLTRPLIDGVVACAYGRQVGNGQSRYSECRIFEKYYPGTSKIPQDGFFCNNANSALLKKVWERHPFDESLTGLEDMHMAKLLVAQGMKIGYVADAGVYHIHQEYWPSVKNRYEREAVALQHIMPEVHVSFVDMLRYVASSIVLDAGEAAREKQLLRRLGEIVMYRCAQYWGVYRGNHFHRKLSKERKERYFYPR